MKDKQVLAHSPLEQLSRDRLKANSDKAERPVINNGLISIEMGETKKTEYKSMDEVHTAMLKRGCTQWSKTLTGGNIKQG